MVSYMANKETSTVHCQHDIFLLHCIVCTVYITKVRVNFMNRYPQCLYLLDLLQYEAFRKELVNSQCAKFIDDQQLLHWQHYQRKRTQLINGQQEKQHSQQNPQQHPSTSQTTQPTTTQAHTVATSAALNSAVLK